jgi:hypothetical protein
MAWNQSNAFNCLYHIDIVLIELKIIQSHYATRLRDYDELVDKYFRPIKAKK